MVRKLIVISTTTLFVFSLSPLALAASPTVVDQLDDTAFEAGVSGYGQDLGISVSGEVSLIRIKYVSNCTDTIYGKPYRRIALFRNGVDVAYFGGFEKSADFCLFKRIDVNTASFIDTPFSMTLGNHYEFVVSQSGAQENYQFFGSTNPDSYADGHIIRFYSGGFQEGVGVLKDLYFELLGPDGAPLLSNLRQEIDQIPLDGQVQIGGSIRFIGHLKSLVNNDVKLEIEVRNIGESFSGIRDDGLVESPLLPSDTDVVITKEGLPNGLYHWRARTTDSVGNMSEWVEFGASDDTDFIIKVVDSPSAEVIFSQVDDSFFEDLLIANDKGQYLGFDLTGEVLYVKIKYTGFCDGEPQGKLLLYRGGGDVATYRGFARNGELCTFKRVDDFTNQFIDTPYSMDGGQHWSIILIQPGTQPSQTARFYGSRDANSYPVGNIARFVDVHKIPIWQEGEGILKDLWFEISGTEFKPDPVIIVPGIMGSWWDDVVIDPLTGEFNPNQLVLDPITHTYDDLFNALANNGYTPGLDLFAFPYDWRFDNRLTATKLRDKITEIRAVCECEKVDIIAHSMGGLVSRYYIESNLYQNDIDQLILLGVPNKGAPKSYLTWEAGELTADKISLDRIQEFLLSSLARSEGFSSRFDYVRGKPLTSVQQLLPAYNYQRDVNSGVLLSYPGGYPGNVFLGESDTDLGLNSSVGLAKLGQSGVRIVNIIGDNGENNTINAIRIVDDSSRLPLWEHGYPENYDSLFGDHGLELSNGDGTVPLTSAQSLNLTNVQQLTMDSGHNELPTHAFDEIFEILTGNLITPIQQTSLIKKWLFVPVFSPVDIQVVDPLGRRVGKDFSSNQEINEIPSAYYTGFGNEELEFLTIPNPINGEYQILLEGTGVGEYTVEISYVDDSTSTQESFLAHTVGGLNQELNFSFNSSAPEATTIVPVDTTPPVITHTFLPTEVMLNHSSMMFSFSAIDDGVGLFNLFAILDDQPLPNGAVVTFTEPGTHTIEIVAEDYVGNIATTTINFDVVYNFSGFLPPIKTDGSGIYKLGRTLPIKFQLTDATGNFVSDVAATLAVAKIEDGVVGTEEIPLSTSTADAGNVFRYDTLNNQYIYNLSTDTMSNGVWQLKVSLNDAQEYMAEISIK